MSAHPLHAHHDRRFESNRFVYPVLSRRAGGISIGVNLNPDKICNFNCVYCQVDRTSPGEERFVETGRLLEELAETIELATSGRLFSSPPFDGVPEENRRLRDVAFSGDGEPTTYRNFDEIVAACAEVRRRAAPPSTRMVLITNAAMFHRRHVRRGLETLDANNGQIWAKLDAGTPEMFRRVARTKVPFERIIENITEAARVRPLVIQTLFFREAGQPPGDSELAAYCERLNEIQRAGGRIGLVQIYTVARAPAESYVSALSSDQVGRIVQEVAWQTNLPTIGY